MRSIFSKICLGLVMLSFSMNGCSGISSGTDSSSEIQGGERIVTEHPTSNDHRSLPASRVSEQQQTDYLDAINAARAETQDCGEYGMFDPAPELVWNVRLGNAAAEHSTDMAQSDFLDHTGSGTQSDETAQAEHLSRGSRLRDRLHHHGYDQWHAIGENISGGDEDAPSAVDTWLKSPVHCANLMSPDFTEVGMMVTQKNGTQYGRYWTVDFGGK